ncbi:MAG: hypothetical protein EOO68_38215 [Moraxellaceae bacterium]|nr:MAG: hypothetical protein EOO68_38215 [Moraxellaceae bacterium]
MQISYDFIDPSGTLIFTHLASFTLAPNNVFSTISLETLEHLFAKSGEYNFTAKVLSDEKPDLTESGSIRVAPNTRIEMTQDLTPKTLIPSASERAKITINLEGKEVQP